MIEAVAKGIEAVVEAVVIQVAQVWATCVWCARLVDWLLLRLFVVVVLVLVVSLLLLVMSLAHSRVMKLLLLVSLLLVSVVLPLDEKWLLCYCAQLLLEQCHCSCFYQDWDSLA